MSIKTKIMSKRLSKNSFQIYGGVFISVFLVMTWAFHYYANKEPTQAVIKDSAQESWNVCRENFIKSDPDEKVIFVITPTFARAEQLAELTRLLQTLIHVKEVLHWIIAEDSPKCSKTVSDFMGAQTDLSYTILSAPMPMIYRVRHLVA